MNYIKVYEESVRPEERFLIIDTVYSFEYPKSVDEFKKDLYSNSTDQEIELIKQEFESFTREYDNPNLYSVGMFKSYADIKLPKTYDIIFDMNNKDRYWKQKTVVKYAYNFKEIFHTDLWNGHSSLVIIEIIGKPPVLFDELPINHESKNKKRTVLGLCSEFEWEFIKKPFPKI